MVSITVLKICQWLMNLILIFLALKSLWDAYDDTHPAPPLSTQQTIKSAQQNHVREKPNHSS
jgi:hypothetical protein